MSAAHVMRHLRTVCSIRLRHFRAAQAQPAFLSSLPCPRFLFEIPSIITKPGVRLYWDMLRNFGQKIQRIVYLIIPTHARRKVFVAGFRKRIHSPFLPDKGFCHQFSDITCGPSENGQREIYSTSRCMPEWSAASIRTDIFDA